ncbi:plasminogen activator inhibitor 1 RNA-binding protein, partial [Trifolium pratense]
MATINPFDLLGDDAEDPSQLIAAEQLKAAAAPKKGTEQGKQAAPKKAAQLPSKPLPPSQAVREARNEPSRGGRGGGRGFGRGRGGGGSGGGGYGRDFSNDDNSLPAPPANQGSFEGDSGNPTERRGYGAPRAPYRVGGERRRGGFSNGEAGEEGRPRRTFDRHSGSGRG